MEEADSEGRKAVDFKAAPEDQLGFWKRLVNACYNRNIYLFPLAERPSKSFFYLAKLVGIIAILLVTVAVFQSWPVITTVGENLREQLPVISFQNGELQVAGEAPVRFQVYEDLTFIIDPPGEVNRARLGDEVVAVLVDGAVFYRYRGGDFSHLSTAYYSDSSQSRKLTITPGWLEEWLPLGQKVFLGLLILGILFDLILVTLARLVLISFGGLVARQKDSPVRLSWGQILLICCYAITPVLLLQGGLGLASLLGVRIGYSDFILLFIGAFWTYSIVNSFERRLVDQQPVGSDRQLAEYWRKKKE